MVLIDGIDYADHAILVAMGIDSRGHTHVLGVREGTTENSAVASALLSDLVDRGLVADRPVLFVIDGGTALRKAIRRVFGAYGAVQRCQVHQLRNVLEHLPEELRPSVRHAMRQAYDASTQPESARCQLERLARSLETDHPGAAASVRSSACPGSWASRAPRPMRAPCPWSRRLASPPLGPARQCCTHRTVHDCSR